MKKTASWMMTAALIALAGVTAVPGVAADHGAGPYASFDECVDDQDENHNNDLALVLCTQLCILDDVPVNLETCDPE